MLMQWTAYNDQDGTYVPSIGEVYHTIMRRGYEINPGSEGYACSCLLSANDADPGGAVHMRYKAPIECCTEVSGRAMVTHSTWR